MKLNGRSNYSLKKYTKKIKNFFAEIFFVSREILWRDTKLALVFYLSLFFNLISWGALWWLSGAGLSIIILHYNSFLGIDFLANFEAGDSPLMIYLVPICGTILWLMDLVICAILLFQSKTKKGEFNQKSVHHLGLTMIVGVNLFLQVAILIYTASIIMVNRF